MIITDLAKLLVVSSLLDQVEDLGGQSLMMIQVRCRLFGLKVDLNKPALPEGKPWGSPPQSSCLLSLFLSALLAKSRAHGFTASPRSVNSWNWQTLQGCKDKHTIPHWTWAKYSKIVIYLCFYLFQSASSSDARYQHLCRGG